ncbi:lytic transglycosylase [Pelomonas sp. HMWF004]|nr:lytic transglycosylase [Pelomonas sp. HMWF004]
MMNREARPAQLAVFAALLMAGLAMSSSARADCFRSAAQIHHVDHRLLRAIAKVESGTKHGYNPEAVNPQSGALGVMQIMPTNFAALRKFDISEQDLHDPCTNINTGAWVLTQFLRQYGPTWRAVGAYGVGNCKSAKCEAQRATYAAKVKAAWQKMKVEQAKKPPVDVAQATTTTSVVE